MGDTGLAGFIEQVTGDSHLRVEEDLGGGFVRLRTSEAERRQAQQDIRCAEDVVLELLRNSRDAGAHVVYVATAREGANRTITVVDDGCGIPDELWQAVFEPRVTSKLDSFHADQWGVHGRGMALFSIACNAREYGVVSSGSGKGTALRVLLDAQELGEKTDQSSLPRLVREEGGRTVIRGTRNINRVVCEFTLNQKGSCVVFLGSPVEVLATMVESGNRALSLAERTFVHDIGDYPLSLRPSLASSPDELVQIAVSLGMALSSRSARRVLDGEVEPLPPFISLLDRTMGEGSKRKPAAAHHAGLTRKPRFDEADLDAFAEEVSHAYRSLAERYYLDAGVKPELKATRSGLSVTIPFVEG